MTRSTNARVAGITFLAYIAVAITSMILSARAKAGEGIAAKLASMAQHVSLVNAAAVLDLLSCFAAVILAVTLYALTRDEDPDLARLGFACRLCEGIVGAVSVQRSMGLLWLATAPAAHAPSAVGARDLASFLTWGDPGGYLFSATFFAVGSTAFAWLFLRGRMIPVGLAWLGLIASLLLVVALPLQIGDVVPGSVVQLLWLPMAAFEVPLGLWLIFKGAAPARRVAA
jgi:uncharacterized protein DUF4386